MRYLITPSLLNSWQYYMDYRGDKEQEVEESFLKDLKREEKPKTEAMQAGIEFENYIRTMDEKNFEILSPPTEQYYLCAMEILSHCGKGVWQPVLKQEITINDTDFLMYGRPDVLKRDHLYDIKFVQSYDTGKYFHSAQHPLYMGCLSGIRQFYYLISDGRNVYIEKYERQDIRPVVSIISDFFTAISQTKFKKIYFDKWQAN